MKGNITAFIAGLVFAAGLVLGGMTQPAKVVGFLDFAGAWDPSLAFVMGAALLVYGVSLRLITRRPRPVAATRFQIPTRRDLTPRLLLGSALFGVGWGLAGFCPGPAITSIGSVGTEALLFVPSMAAGTVLFTWWDRWQAARAPAPQSNGNDPSVAAPSTSTVSANP
jgi:uncharacterized membrane protein YedE/YeeE